MELISEHAMEPLIYQAAVSIIEHIMKSIIEPFIELEPLNIRNQSLNVLNVII